MDLAPKTATVLRNGQELTVPIEEIRVGDRIRVRPGERIGADGSVVEGTSAVDESALTGESIPVEKGPGDTVISASINKSGSFVFEATRVGRGHDPDPDHSFGGRCFRYQSPYCPPGR